MNENTINIALSIDHNFVQHCAVTIVSIMKSYKGTSKVMFYIINDDLTAGNESDLKRLLQNHKFEITFIKIDKQMFKDMPVGGHTISDAISLSSYYRIALSQLLSPKIKKIIYLDADIYVNDSIDKLWQMDLTGYAIAGVPQPQCLATKKRLEIPNNFKYVNAGVSIMNLTLMREIDYTRKAIEYARNNFNKIIYHDQDIANALLYDKTLYLPYKWNMVDCYLYKKPPLSGKALNEVITYQNTPSIIHFAGYLKPWHKECRNPYRNLYWKALQNTPWENSPKKFREKTWFKELKLIIKLILKRPTYFKL